MIIRILCLSLLTRRNRMVAIRAVAHKLARAAYFVQRDRVQFDTAKLFD